MWARCCGIASAERLFAGLILRVWRHAAGASTLNLRNLGDERTLVLKTAAAMWRHRGHRLC